MLTSRERDIIDLIIEGNTNKDIAKKLNISIHTVNTHVEHIFLKFNVHSKIELTIKIIKDSTISGKKDTVKNPIR